VKEKITYVEDLDRVKSLEEKIHILLTEIEKLNSAMKYKNDEIAELQMQLKHKPDNSEEVIALRREINSNIDYYTQEIQHL